VRGAGVSLVRAHDAPQSHLATVFERQHDVHTCDATHLLEHGAGTRAESGPLLPALQRLPERKRQEADQDVGLDAILSLVPDRADLQIALLDPEGGLRLAELDVGAPQLFRAPIGHVGAQDVGALGELRPLAPLLLEAPAEPQARRTLGVLPDLDPEGAGGAPVALQHPADLPLHLGEVGGLARLLEPTAERLQSEALVHRLLLGLAIHGAAEQKRLLAIGSRTDLHLEAVAHVLPAVPVHQLALPLLQLAFRRTHEVAALAFAQPLQVVLADHPAVHHPDAARLAVSKTS
jgi:hypothetical protein